ESSGGGVDLCVKHIDFALHVGRQKDLIDADVPSIGQTAGELLQIVHCQISLSHHVIQCRRRALVKPRLSVVQDDRSGAAAPEKLWSHGTK
ncbi:hypothetical protein B296_00026556, partial [Ensete ventricosum]